MLQSERAEFEAQLGNLCAGFNVPVGDRVEAYWRGLAKMELRTFVRVVEHCLGEEGPERIPTTKACWALSKVIRPKRYVPAEPEKQWKGDHWDIEANLRLLQHVRNHPKKYAPDASYDPAIREAVPGPLTRIYTGIVVQWKNSWAEDMRVEPNPTAETKRAAWDDCIARADAQIAQLEQRARAA